MHGIIFALLADNGRQFNNHAFNEFYNNLGVELKFCSPAHPKVNGQAETTKKIIKKLLKTWSGEKNGPWVDELVVVLWAYKTTHKTAMSETPFALAFGHEAVINVVENATNFPKPIQIIYNSGRFHIVDGVVVNQGLVAQFSLVPWSSSSWTDQHNVKKYN